MVLVGTGLAEEHEVKYPMPPRTDTAHKANRWRNTPRAHASTRLVN